MAFLLLLDAIVVFLLSAGGGGRRGDWSGASSRRPLMSPVSIESADGVSPTTGHLDRRKLIDNVALAALSCAGGVVLLSPLPAVSMTAAAAAAAATIDLSSSTDDDSFGVSNTILSSLVVEKILGQGAFKTVYLVSGFDDNDHPVRYALAVERLRNKQEVRDAMQGIRMAEFLQKSSSEPKYFEQVQDWWIQDTSISTSQPPPPAPLFPMLPQTSSNTQRSRQQVPSRFLGSKWLIALKPVYDTDLKSFCRKLPLVYDIPAVAFAADAIPQQQQQQQQQDVQVPRSFAGIRLDEPLALATNLCHAGRLLHDELGYVHRDIKPKNIMLSQGHVVMIDFEFCRRGKVVDGNRVCVVQAGRVKGEARYALAPDVALDRGCQEGDCYAMGKTLYEVLFGVPDNEPSNAIGLVEPVVQAENDRFRSKLALETPRRSRFLMSREECDLLLKAIVGLTRPNDPFSFSRAEDLLVNYSSAPRREH